MRMLIAALALLGFVSAAEAATVTVTYTLPTTYTDGSALALADVASTTVEQGSCSGTSFGTKASQKVVTGAGASTTFDLPAGTYCFRAATTVIAAKGGGTSAFSNVAQKVVPFPNPSPPTIVDVILAWLRRIFGHFA